MPILSLSDAVRTVGVARSILYRAISNGTIATIRRDHGRTGLDTSELLRVFGRLQPGGSAKTTHEASSDIAERQLLQARLELAEREVQMLREALQAARERENRRLGILERRWVVVSERLT